MPLKGDTHADRLLQCGMQVAALIPSHRQHGMEKGGDDGRWWVKQ